MKRVMMRKMRACMVAGVCALTLSMGSASANYTNLYAFGDSLSDSGNMYNAVWALSGGTVQVPPPPYYQGRASNGPVAVEYLAQYLGLSAKPVIDMTGNIDPEGTNYAVLGSATGPVAQSGGTTYSNYMTFRYSASLPDVGIDFQVHSFADLTDGLPDGVIGGAADPQALYFLWGGANDAYLALEDPALDQDDAAQMNAIASATALQAAQGLGAHIQSLAALGARDFLVPNLPDLGRTPDAIAGSADGTYGSAYAPALTLYTDTFNATLASLLVPLDADPALRVFAFDVHGLFQDYVASGLYDTLHPCMTTPGCDPDTYLFWDGVHPTTHFHDELGRHMAQAVPEPAAYLLLMPALLLIAWAVRARA